MSRRTANHPFIKSVSFTPSAPAPVSIHDATKARCIEEQGAQRDCAHWAHEYAIRGLIGRAAQEQREAAYHYDQAWMRLARLIGAA